MSLTKSDKEWIVSVIVEGIRPLSAKIDNLESEMKEGFKQVNNRIDNLVVKNNLIE